LFLPQQAKRAGGDGGSKGRYLWGIGRTIQRSKGKESSGEQSRQKKKAEKKRKRDRKLYSAYTRIRIQWK